MLVRGPASRSVHWLAGLVFGAGLPQWLVLPVDTDGVRLWMLSAWSVAALALAVILTWDWRWLRIALLVFSATLVLGWTRGLGSTTATTHFAGASLGLLWMALVGKHAVTPERLTLGVAAFLGAGALALVVGMSGVPGLFPPEAYFFLTGDGVLLRRALVSAEGNEVNQNALAALVLLVIPVAASCLWMRSVPRTQQYLLQALSALLCLGGAWILVVTRSRTALIAVWLLMMLVLTISRKRSAWTLLIGCGTAATPLAGLVWLYLVPSERLAEAVGRVQYVLQDRVHILVFATKTLADNLWFGIGLNEFRHLYVSPDGLENTTAHAHNVLLQVGLDVGLIGLIAYCCVVVLLLVHADRANRGQIAIARTVAAGSAFSLIAVHLFGLADAVSLGAKIGLLQWMAGGLILGSLRLQRGSAGDLP